MSKELVVEAIQSVEEQYNMNKWLGDYTFAEMEIFEKLSKERFVEAVSGQIGATGMKVALYQWCARNDLEVGLGDVEDLTIHDLIKVGAVEVEGEGEDDLPLDPPPLPDSAV